MKQSKAPQTTMESVARSIGSTLGKAVRTASEVADDIAVAAKKVRSALPKKSARKKVTTRAKKPMRAASGLKTDARKIVRTTQSPAKRATSKRRKR